MTTGNRTLLEVLNAEGVTTIFSLLSEELMDVTMAAARDFERVNVVQARHEQSAVAMADGFSRIGGDIGVAMVGRGPAIAQTGTAITTAYNHGSSVLIVVATRARDAFTDDLNKGFRQEAFLESLVDDVYAVRSEGTLVPSLAEAFRTLHADRGPVVVQVPRDILDGELADAGSWRDTTVGTSRPTRTAATLQPAEEDVETAVTLYEERPTSEPPVILAGAGAVTDGATDAIESLAERLNAVIVTTLQARTFLADHPYMAGFVGGLGDGAANALLERSGFALALGASLNDHTTRDGDLIEETTLVHVDVDPAQLDRYEIADLSIVGGAAATARALEGALERHGVDERGRFWTDELAQRLRTWADVDAREYEPEPGRIDPRVLLDELDDCLPQERVVVTDTGQLTGWVIDRIGVAGADEFIWPMDFGSIGLGQPIGIGAAYRSAGRPVVVFCGDGGFLMSLQELNTAVRAGLPLVLVVVNDDALGAEYQRMRSRDGPASPALLETPAFATVAEGFGADGYTIRSTDDLARVAAGRLREPTGPVVLDCKVDQRIPVASFDPERGSDDG
ncbi:MAG: thiamine pyrophosphate-binding protein [Salinigranum sp.]